MLQRSSSVLNITNSVDAIDLERSVFNKIAGTGQLYMFRTNGMWSQIKTAGSVVIKGYPQLC